MTVQCFIDTNVLIYAATAMNEFPAKHKIANDIIHSQRFCVSAQVLQEFYVAVQKKPREPLSRVQAAEWVGWLQPFCEVVVDGFLVDQAIKASSRHQISYWDGAIVAAAARISAPILYTEDLNHGQTYGSVKVINPFRPA